MDYSAKIAEITSSKEAFSKTVYTPISEALRMLNDRLERQEIDQLIKPYFKDGLPDILNSGPRVVIFRQVITPNYEIRRFLCVPDATKIPPLFFEYHKDKFTSNNPIKYYLGKLAFHHGIGKKGGNKLSYRMVIDFNESNGKEIHEVKTLGGKSLVEFHHSLLGKFYKDFDKHLFDASDWFHSNGKTAREYYKSYVALFVKNAILFENFILDGDELNFTKEIFLPAFLEVWDKTGEKPLIVALEPTEIEGDLFWMCHPADTIVHIE